MKSRGHCIKELNFTEVEKLDAEINKMIRDSKMYRNLTEPVCAFITFERTEGKTEAVTYSKEMRKRKKRDNTDKIEFG